MSVYVQRRGQTFPTLTVSGASTLSSLNVGSATGAGIGDVRASGALNAGSATNTTAGNVAGSGVLALAGVGLSSLAGSLSIILQPLRSRYRSATQAIANNTTTAFAHDAENANVGDIAYSAGFWTIGTGGVYVVTLGIVWTANATGNRGALINVGGSLVAQQFAPNCGAVISACNSVTWIGQLAAAAQVTFSAYQDSGGALNIAASPGSFAAIMKVA